MHWSAAARQREGARNAGTGDRPAITWSAGAICLHDHALFADPSASDCRLFLRRVFLVDQVRAVSIDRSRGVARIEYEPEALRPDAMLERVAAALRDGKENGSGAHLGALPPAEGAWTALRIVRSGSMLTTWDVVHESRGRVRLRNDALCSDQELAHRIVRELSAVGGVTACDVRRVTGSLLVRFEPAVLDTCRLVRILDRLLAGSAHALAHAGDPAPAPFAVANASVGLAALGEFALPALLPASALLLVGSNVPTLRAAWSELRTRRPGLPVLYATIIAATLASGQFLAAALMAWMVKFWHRQHRGRLLATRRLLLPGIAQHHRLARRASPDTAEVLLDELRPGDCVTVPAGGIVPADGRVFSGWALVEEGLLHGRGGVLLKPTGSRVFAGSRVHEGELKLEVERVGSSTHAAALARALFSAAVPAASRSAVTAHGQQFAERTVVPTLATAGLGLLVGDLTTAAAVLRPDYATGPGLGVALELLEDTAECARRGVVVRDPSALRRLAEADLFLFDDHAALLTAPLEVARIWSDGPAAGALALRCAATAFQHLADARSAALVAACEIHGLAALGTITEYHDGAFVVGLDGRDFTVIGTSESVLTPVSLVITDGERVVARIDFRRASRPYAAAAIAQLRSEARLSVGLVTGRSNDEARGVAETLGVGHVRAGLSPEAKLELLHSYRARGRKVALVADGRSQPELANAAYVALSTAGDIESKVDPSSIVLMSGDVTRVGWLREFARSHVERVHAVHGATLIPNLLCVAGAFFLGFTSMSSVLITNLGTLGVYARLPQRIRRRSRPETVRPRAAAGGFGYNRLSSREEEKAPWTVHPTGGALAHSAHG